MHIKDVHAETCSAYGWPRIWRELDGTRCPSGQAAGAKTHATLRHSCQGQAPLQGHHRQPPQIADFAKPARPLVQCSRAR